VREQIASAGSTYHIPQPSHYGRLGGYASCGELTQRRVCRMSCILRRTCMPKGCRPVGAMVNLKHNSVRADLRRVFGPAERRS